MNKRIVLCLDGTWNTPSQELERDDGSRVYRPTNVLKVARAVRPTAEDGKQQIVYYDTGIGAMAQYPGMTNGVLRWFDSKLGGAWGAGFEGNVDEAYRFLANNFEDGDEVYVFGYSRGAAQAQALCKFIDWMHGLPAKSDIYFLPRFYLHYLTTRGRKDEFDKLKHSIETTGSNKQKMQPFRSLRVNFLGLWDTVASLGSRAMANSSTSSRNKRFLLSDRLPDCVDRARHAIAIDEIRKDFRAEVWRAGNSRNDMRQAWFPGGHGNVGGGRSTDGLANGALKWVLSDATELDTDPRYLSFFKAVSDATLSNLRATMYKVRDPWSIFDKDSARRPIVDYDDASKFEIPQATLDRLGSDTAEVEYKKGKVRVESYEPANLLAYLAKEPKYHSKLNAIAKAKLSRVK